MNNLDKQIRKLLSEATVTIETDRSGTEVYSIDNKLVKSAKNAIQKNFAGQLIHATPAKQPEGWADPTEGKSNKEAAMQALMSKAEGVTPNIANVYLTRKLAQNQQKNKEFRFRIDAGDVPPTGNDLGTSIANYMNVYFSDPQSVSFTGKPVANKNVGAGEPALAVAFNSVLDPKVEPDFVFKGGEGYGFSVKSFYGSGGGGARTGAGKGEAKATKALVELLLTKLGVEKKIEKGSVMSSVFGKKLFDLWTDPNDRVAIPADIDNTLTQIADAEKKVLDVAAGAVEEEEEQTSKSKKKDQKSKKPTSAGILYLSKGARPWKFTPTEKASNDLCIIRLDLGTNRATFHERAGSGKKSFHDEIVDAVAAARKALKNPAANQQVTTSAKKTTAKKPSTSTPASPSTPLQAGHERKLESKIRDTIKEMLKS